MPEAPPSARGSSTILASAPTRSNPFSTLRRLAIPESMMAIMIASLQVLCSRFRVPRSKPGTWHLEPGTVLLQASLGGRDLGDPRVQSSRLVQAPGQRLEDRLHAMVQVLAVDDRDMKVDFHIHRKCPHEFLDERDVEIPDPPLELGGLIDQIGAAADVDH